MSQLAARRGAAAAGAAAITAAATSAASDTPAESRAAPSSNLVVSDDALANATALLKSEMVKRGELEVATSPDGSEWILDVNDLLDFSEAVAKEPQVQKTIMEKAKVKDNALRLLRGSTPSPLSQSFEYVQKPQEAEPLSRSDRSPSLTSLSPSMSEILKTEKQVDESWEDLKAENAALKAQLASLQGRPTTPTTTPCPRPGVARLQAAARGLLTRRGYYDDLMTAIRLAPVPPTVAVKCVPVFEEEGGALSVKLNLDVIPGRAGLRNIKTRPTTEKVRPPPQAHAKVPDGLLVSVSVVIGLLALLISRNPAAARVAATGAAGVIFGLVHTASLKKAQQA